MQSVWLLALNLKTKPKMQLNTKLNIGETVWHISRSTGCIIETAITKIHITVVPKEPSATAIINYDTDNGYIIAEDSEGQTWWRTRDAILSHITKVKSQPTPSKPTLKEEFEKWFSEPTDKCYDQSSQCDGRGGCGCQSRANLSLEEDLNHFLTSLAETKEYKAFAKELDKGSNTVKTALNTACNELDNLYEQIVKNRLDANKFAEDTFNRMRKNMPNYTNE